MNQGNFTIDRVDDVNIVTISGEVDIANVDQLRAVLDSTTVDDELHLVVDLTHTSYFDSRTVAVLANLATNFRGRRQRMALVAPSDGFAARILQIAGLPLIVPVFQSVADGVGSLKLPAGA